MFITENQNIGDSVLFLLSSRAALANIIEASGTKNSSDLISFIHNEASDYEIMNLLVNGSLPDEKYNDVAEMLLFSEFKESVMMNKDFVIEMVGEDTFYNVLHEVDSLYMGISTASPIIEFASMQDQEIAIACMINEAGVGAKIVAGQSAKALAKKKAQHAAQAKLASMKGANVAIGKHKVGSAVAAGKKAVMDKVAAAKGSLGKATAGAKGKIIGKGGRAAPTSGAKMKAAGKYYGAKVGAAGKIAAGKTAAFAATPAGMAVGGAAAAALAIYAGAKIYKRFLSQAAKSCGGQSGAAKTACMSKYKKQAIMKQAAAIQSASSTCAKSKDPAKCKAAVAKKVQSLKSKAAAIA